MRECMRTLVDFHRVDASLREFPHLCLGEPTTSRESHRLGGTAVNDLTVRGARAQQNLLEWSRRAAEPEQRPGGNPLVHGSRHQAKDLLELAEKSLCRHDRAAEAAAGAAAGA